MSKGDVTLKDIAQAVGKSVAAVSRALHDYPDISIETRAHIKKVAQEMGYRPNILAQRLQKQRTDTLGFILPTPSPRLMDPYFSELLAGLAAEAAAHGFDLLVATSPPGAEEERAYERLVEGRRVDGLVLARVRRDDPRIVYLANQEFPFVAIGRAEYQGDDFPHIWLDVRPGFQAVIEHLQQQGFAKIGFIAPPPELTFAVEGLAAFRGAMRRLNLAVHDDWLTSSDFSQRGGYQAAHQLLSKAKAPQAVVTCHDLVGLGVVAAAQDQGLEIGRDLAVTGFGNIPLAEYMQPPLTSLHQPTYAMGQRACRMLARLIKGEPLEKTRVVIEPSLVIRQSSGLELWL
ncbi:MAG: LacI family DNA-binding transcriptional regulator [Anaerolineae bacterium]